MGKIKELKKKMTALFARRAAEQKPLKFSQIPRHNQLDVLKKLDFKDFVQFQQCSAETMEITKTFRHPVPMKVSRITFESPTPNENSSLSLRIGERISKQEQLPSVRFKVKYFQIAGEIPNAKFADIEDFCRRRIESTEKLVVGKWTATHEQWMIDRLIVILNPSALHIVDCSSSYLLNLSEIGKVKNIDFYQGKMEESDLLLLRNPGMRIFGNPIRAPTVNTFLKQWLEGQRDISHFVIFPIPKHLAYSEKYFKNLEFDVIWSPETHGSSPFAHLKAEIEKKKLAKIYSLERSDGKKIFIGIDDFYEQLKLTAREYEETEEIEEWIRDIYGH